jgi:hypothetical protein
VRPGRERGPPPLKLHTWVVAFCLGQQRDPHNEAERAAEILKRELPGQDTGTVALPARDLLSEPGTLRLRQWGRPRRVLLAVLVDQLGNDSTVLTKRRVYASSHPFARDSDLVRKQTWRGEPHKHVGREDGSSSLTPRGVIWYPRGSATAGTSTGFSSTCICT